VPEKKMGGDAAACAAGVFPIHWLRCRSSSSSQSRGEWHRLANPVANGKLKKSRHAVKAL